MKESFRVPSAVILCAAVLICWGCELSTGNMGAGDNGTIREMERSITDLEKKLTELTREVAELDERVARNEAALDAYVSGTAQRQVEEEAVSEVDTPADKGTPLIAPEETPSRTEDEGATSSAAPRAEGINQEETGAVPVKEAAPKDAQALYDKALSEIMNRKAEVALVQFNEFVTAYPNDDLTDNAFYWIGECHYLLGDYPKALEVFRKVKDNFPGKDKVPDAILKMGYCYEKLGDTQKARETYTELIETYPDNPTTDLARERLK